MDKRPEWWCTVDGEEEFLERRNEVILIIDAYITNGRLESDRDLKNCSTEILEAAKGRIVESSVLETNENASWVRAITREQLSPDLIPASFERDPGSIIVDAISAGFAWVNPNSLSVRKLIMILKKLKNLDEQPLRKGIDEYMKGSAVSPIDTAEMAQNRREQSQHIFSARLYTERLIDTMEFSTISVITKEAVRKRKRTTRTNSRCIKLCTLCIQRDPAEKAAFLEAWYRVCIEEQPENTEQLWATWQENLDHNRSLDASLEGLVPVLRDAMRSFSASRSTTG
ncbi:hypothetical protein PG984_012905 [Apiospora sp. TS-2023a]